MYHSPSSLYILSSLSSHNIPLGKFLDPSSLLWCNASEDPKTDLTALNLPMNLFSCCLDMCKSPLKQGHLDFSYILVL